MSGVSCYPLSSNRVSLITGRYHVPKIVQHHIDYITPGIRLASYGFEEKVARQQKKRARREVREVVQSDLVASEQAAKPIQWTRGGCDRFVTPKCIRSTFTSGQVEYTELFTKYLLDQYGLPNETTNTATPGNELGIFQSLNQHYWQGDLDAYFHNIAP
jgi:tripeptidyl-peptidase I